MKINLIDPTNYPISALKFYSDEMKDSYTSFMKCHFEFMDECSKTKCHLDGYKHMVFIVTNQSDHVIGHRYFYYNVRDNFCYFFWTYIAEPYRNRGIAKEIILRSIYKAIDDNIESGIVCMSSIASSERDNLYAMYCHLVDYFRPKISLEVRYSSKRKS